MIVRLPAVERPCACMQPLQTHACDMLAWAPKTGLKPVMQQERLRQTAFVPGCGGSWPRAAAAGPSGCRATPRLHLAGWAPGTESSMNFTWGASRQEKSVSNGLHDQVLSGRVVPRDAIATSWMLSHCLEPSCDVSLFGRGGVHAPMRDLTCN